MNLHFVYNGRCPEEFFLFDFFFSSLLLFILIFEIPTDRERKERMFLGEMLIKLPVTVGLPINKILPYRVSQSRTAQSYRQCRFLFNFCLSDSSFFMSRYQKPPPSSIFTTHKQTVEHGGEINSLGHSKVVHSAQFPPSHC